MPSAFRTVLTTALLSLPAAAQQPAAPPPQQTAPGFTLQVNSQIVVLDVVVTDKQGHIVTNLTGDDFKVFEDKTPQKILSFEPAKVPSAAATAAAPAIHSTAELDRLEPNAPVSIIVLDEVTSLFEDQAFARYSLKKYLKTEGDTLSQPTMLMAVGLDHQMVLHDYTTSKQEILEALDHHFATTDWRQRGGSWKSEQFNAAFTSLISVAQATTGHPGHKNLVWVGRGFPSIRMDLLSDEQAAQLDAAIAQCTNLMRDARITLYTIDPAGISAAPPATDEDGFFVDDPFGGQVNFDEMARATGGQTFHGRNDVDRLIGDSVQDGESFYTITYRPSTVSDDPKAFRKIQVFTANRTFTATTREGYYAGSAPVAPALDANGKLNTATRSDLVLASQSLIVYDGLPLTLLRAPDKPGQVSISFPASDLGWQPEDNGKQKADITLILETFDRKGKLLHQNARELAIELAPPPEGKQESRTVHLHESIETEPPAARIRIIVRSSGTGKIGADNVYLVDPKTLADPTTGQSYKRPH